MSKRIDQVPEDDGEVETKDPMNNDSITLPVQLEDCFRKELITKLNPRLSNDEPGGAM